MKIIIKSEDDEGGVKIEGTLNAVEHQYLIQFAINGLMAMGATMAFDEEDKGDLRIKFHGDNALN